MFSLARRFALRFSTALLFGILNALFTMAVLSGQWLTSAAGDSALLSFEAAVVVLALLLVAALLLSCADPPSHSASTSST